MSALPLLKLVTSCSIFSTAFLLTACGGGGTDTPQTSVDSVMQMPASTPKLTIKTASSNMQNTQYAAAIAAAVATANADKLCTVAALGDFYWEIGTADDTLPLASGMQGKGSVDADSHFNIASASKWMFGAYVLEKKGIDEVRSNSALSNGLRFLSGYTGMNDDACVGKTTIAACFIAGMKGNTGQPDPATLGKFDYDSGHDQKLASTDLGLGNFSAAQLDQEYQNTLGLSKTANMAALDPLMAGGMMASANDDASFLRKIMRQELEIGRYLGDQAVCTLPLACPGKVAYSPIVALGEPWTYSYNHWVESEQGKGTIDAYSSPGKWGFYPWISPDRKYYGVLSRLDKSPDSYAASVKCGRQIRKAFMAAL